MANAKTDAQKDAILKKYGSNWKDAQAYMNKMMGAMEGAMDSALGSGGVPTDQVTTQSGADGWRS